MTFTCRRCGGETDRDAWARWDEAGQQWVLGATLDAGGCRSCRGEAPAEPRTSLRRTRH